MSFKSITQQSQHRHHSDTLRDDSLGPRRWERPQHVTRQSIQKSHSPSPAYLHLPITASPHVYFARCRKSSRRSGYAENTRSAILITLLRNLAPELRARERASTHTQPVRSLSPTRRRRRRRQRFIPRALHLSLLRPFFFCDSQLFFVFLSPACDAILLFGSC